MRETAIQAKKMGFNYFSSTLLVSPYQYHEDLRSIGEKISRRLVSTFVIGISDRDSDPVRKRQEILICTGRSTVVANTLVEENN
jgi:predicted adenine nucleotide alpha hydrolase (AANH) superfamily ATPase